MGKQTWERQVDRQKKMNGSIFGGGYLLSDRAIAEKAIAEKIELSDREKALVKALKNTPRGMVGRIRLQKSTHDGGGQRFHDYEGCTAKIPTGA